MANKTETIKIKVGLSGIEESIKKLEALKGSLPTHEMEALTKKALGFFKVIEEATAKGTKLSLKELGVKELEKSLTDLSIAMNKKLSFSGITIDVKHFDENIKTLENKVKESKANIEKLELELEQSRKNMLEKMASKYGENIDESFLDTTKTTRESEKINLNLQKASNEEERKVLEERQKNWQMFISDLQEYNKQRQSIGSQLGGTKSGLGKNISLLEIAKAEKAQTEKIPESDYEGERVDVQDLARAYNQLSDVIKSVHELKAEEAHIIAAKEVEKHKEEIRELSKEEEELHKAQQKGEKSILAKVAAGLSYYTVFNNIKKLIKESIKVVRELDSAMTQASIVTNMTRQEAWSLLESYQNLAEETGKTTSEIANLNAFFLQQGKTVSQAAEMTEVAAKSAAVAGASLQDAANYITSAIHGFGLAADEAERVADRFAALGARSASSFEEIAIAMSKVAPVAQSAGVGIDFMMAILSKGIHTTREAPEAIGTAMKTIFARMRELTDIGKATEDGMSLNRVEKALNSIGVDLRDTTNEFRNLEDVLIDVGMKWDTLTSMEQAYLATALAGTRQQPRLLAVLNDFDTTLEFIKISEESEKALKYQHMDYMGSMEASSNRLRNSWEKIVNTIVNSDFVIKVFHTLADALSGVANTVEFVAERWYLLVPVLGILTGITIKFTTALFANTLAKVKNAAAETGRAIAAVIFGKQGFLNINLTNLETVAIERNTLASVKSTAATLGLAAAKMAAIAAIAALVYFGIKSWKELRKGVEDYADEVDNSNKKVYESRKKINDLNALKDEYDELTKKVHKSNEEMIRMGEILDELGDFNVGDGANPASFVVGTGDDRSIDYEAVRKFEKEQNKLQRDELQEQSRLLGKSFKKDFKGTLDNPTMFAVFEEYGQAIADSMSAGIDKELHERASRTTVSGMQYIDMSDFERQFKNEALVDSLSIGGGVLGGAGAGAAAGALIGSVVPVIGTALGAVIGGIGGAIFGGIKASEIREDWKAERSVLWEELGKEIGEIYSDSLEMHQAVLNAGEDIGDQAKAFKEHLDGALGSNKMLSSLFKEAYPELNSLVMASESLNKSLEETVKIVENLNKRGIGSQTFFDQATRYGLGEVSYVDPDAYLGFLGSSMVYIHGMEAFSPFTGKNTKTLLPPEIEQGITEYKRLTKEYSAAQGALTAATISGDEDRINSAQEAYDMIGDRLDILGRELPVLTLKDAHTSALWDKYGKEIGETIEGSIDPEKLSQTIVKYGKELYNVLKNTDEAFDTEDEAIDAARKIFGAYTLGADQLLAKYQQVGKVVEDLVNLPEELAKGNIDALASIADELGAEGLDIIDRFLQTGDLSEITDALAENQTQELEIRKAEILAGKTLEELSDFDRVELFKIEQQLKLIPLLTKEYDYWNSKMEQTSGILDRIGATMDFIDKLDDLEIQLNVSGLQDFAKSMEKIADERMKKDVENTFRLRQDALSNLIDLGIMDADGNMLREPTGMIEEQRLNAFYSAHDLWIESLDKSLSETERRIDRVRTITEKEIAEMEKLHKEQMDIITKQYDEKWRAIDYENKILELQEKVTTARNQLASAMFGNNLAGQKDAAKALREAREARQKEIEKQILDDIKRKEEEALQERIEAREKIMAEDIGIIRKSFEDIAENGIIIKEMPEQEVTVQPQQVNSSRGGGGGVFHALMVADANIGVIK